MTEFLRPVKAEICQWNRIQNTWASIKIYNHLYSP